MIFLFPVRMIISLAPSLAAQTSETRDFLVIPDSRMEQNLLLLRQLLLMAFLFHPFLLLGHRTTLPLSSVFCLVVVIDYQKMYAQ